MSSVVIERHPFPRGRGTAGSGEGPRSCRVRAAGALVLISLVLGLLAVPLVVGGTLGPSSQAPGGAACSHVLQAAANGSGGERECFLNSTSALAFTPGILSIPANSTVVFSVQNLGGVPHTFALDSRANDTNLSQWTSAPGGVSPSAVNSYFANHSASFLYINSTGPYASSPVRLPQPHGIYYFVCTVPGHFQAGMWGVLYVGVSPPAASLVPQLTTPTQGGILILLFSVLLLAGALILLPRFLDRPRISPEGDGP